MINPKSPRGFSLWRRAGLFFGANMGNKESSNVEGGDAGAEHQGASGTMSGMSSSVKSGLVKRKDNKKMKKGKQKGNSMTMGGGGGGGDDLATTTTEATGGFTMVGTPMGADPMTAASPLQSSGSIKPGKVHFNIIQVYSLEYFMI